MPTDQEHLRQEVEQLKNQVADLETQLRSQAGSSLTRRGALAGLAGAGLVGAASQPAAAASSPWNDGDSDALLETDNSYDGIDVVEGDIDEFNNQRIYDTTGRYHAALDGSNDAQKVIDAINDRRSGAGIIIPDPGFDLDWEQQVDLPADEAGFALLTQGTPTLSIPSGFSGSYAINKPGSTAGTANLIGYKIGSFIADDSANKALSFTINMTDIKESIVYNPIIREAPGIRLESANGTWSNQNLVFKPYGRSSRGPLVEMTYANGETPDQNWVFAPLFNDKNNETEVAFRDSGKDNSWLWTRVEFAKTVFEANGAFRYIIHEADWDRASDMDFTVKETAGGPGNPNGRIYATGWSRYKNIRLLSPSTEVNISGVDQKVGNKRPGVVNVFDQIRKLTTAHTLNSIGLTDNSSGGSAEINNTFFHRPFIRLSTGGSSGNTAEVSTGSKSLKPQNAFPKIGWGLGQTGSGDRSNVVARVGIFEDSSNRAEIIYDPANDLGNHSADNWYFEVETGSGGLHISKDMTVSPSDAQAFTINRSADGNGNPRWTASIDQANVVRTGTGGATMGPAEIRYRIRTLESSSKTWDMDDEDDGTMLYRIG